MKTNEEKIVPLHEDSNKHIHDDASWKKLEKEQKNQKEKIEKMKNQK